MVIGINSTNSVDIHTGTVALDNGGDLRGLESGLCCVGIDYLNQLGSHLLV
jgi:hypothetical protein